MSKVAKVKRWFDGSVKTRVSRPDTLILECEFANPPSLEGQTVYVWLERDDVTDVLLLAREAAIAARSTPDRGGPVDGSTV